MLDKRLDQVEFTPSEYFEYVKEKKKNITDDDLKNIYDNCLRLLNKYLLTGQDKAALKLKFHLETIEKEREIVALGIDSFVYKDDIEYFINNVADDVVKIIEMENYEREIPDEIVEGLALVKDKFSAFYIVFTDYTGEVERQVEKERRDKDPILFGTFEDKDTGTIVERFYFLGDWEDEYCDLTLDKLVTEMKTKADRDILHSTTPPKTYEELQEQLDQLKEKHGRFRRSNSIITQGKHTEEKKQGLFSKVKSFLKKGR